MFVGYKQLQEWEIYNFHLYIYMCVFACLCWVALFSGKKNEMHGCWRASMNFVKSIMLGERHILECRDSFLPNAFMQEIQTIPITQIVNRTLCVWEGAPIKITFKYFKCLPENFQQV